MDEMGSDSSDASVHLNRKSRSRRQKNIEKNKSSTKRSNAMAQLKEKRKHKAQREKKEEMRQLETDGDEDLQNVSESKSLTKLKVPEIYSDDSDCSDSEDNRRRTTKRSSYRSYDDSSESDTTIIEDVKRITTRDELNKLRISRFKIERFLGLPTFKNTVLNCFVRISIGKNSQKPVYRVAEIVGVVETGKIYKLGRIRTNRGLRVKHGLHERVFRLEFISNQEFTENEFQKWYRTCTDQNIPTPTLETITRKLADIKNAINYVYNDEDVDRIVAENLRFQERPTNYAMRKTVLLRERDAAMIRGDDDIVNNLGKQLEELENEATELYKRRTSSISAISYINDRNRRRNIEQCEKALLEEANENRGLKTLDPFTRRNTKPRMGFQFLTATETDTAPSSYNNEQEKEKEEKEEEERLESTEQKITDEKDLYTLHNFDIDIDFNIKENLTNTLPELVPKPVVPGLKRALNLQDYKKKRGLI